MMIIIETSAVAHRGVKVEAKVLLTSSTSNTVRLRHTKLWDSLSIATRFRADVIRNWAGVNATLWVLVSRLIVTGWFMEGASINRRICSSIQLETQTIKILQSALLHIGSTQNRDSRETRWHCGWWALLIYTIISYTINRSYIKLPLKKLVNLKREGLRRLAVVILGLLGGLGRKGLLRWLTPRLLDFCIHEILGLNFFLFSILREELNWFGFCRSLLLARVALSGLSICTVFLKRLEKSALYWIWDIFCI